MQTSFSNVAQCLLFKGMSLRIRPACSPVLLSVTVDRAIVLALCALMSEVLSAHFTLETKLSLSETCSLDAKRAIRARCLPC